MCLKNICISQVVHTKIVTIIKYVITFILIFKKYTFLKTDLESPSFKIIKHGKTSVACGVPFELALLATDRIKCIQSSPKCGLEN